MVVMAWNCINKKENYHSDSLMIIINLYILQTRTLHPITGRYTSLNSVKVLKDNDLTLVGMIKKKFWLSFNKLVVGK